MARQTKQATELSDFHGEYTMHWSSSTRKLSTNHITYAKLYIKLTYPQAILFYPYTKALNRSNLTRHLKRFQMDYYACTRCVEYSAWTNTKYVDV